MSKYLLEIGTEELPYRFIPQAIEQLEEGFKKFFEENKVEYKNIDVLATPRRLAVIVEGLSKKQPDEEKIIKGPPKNTACDEKGNLTQAGKGFLNKNGIDEKDAYIKDDYLHAKVFIKGKLTSELLEENIAQIVLKLQGPYFMRWGANDEKFSRPIRWIMSILDDKELPVEMVGVKSSKFTRGHRFAKEKTIEINNPDEYVEKLREAYVIVNQNERKDKIENIVKNKCYRINPKLIEEVTYLCEWPVACECEFNPKYLDIPEMVTVTVMQCHQRYFPIYKDSKLTNKFITITNYLGDDFSNIKAGNERVVTARLEDAIFFFKEDTKKPLAKYVEDLKGMTFQKGMGTMYDKAQRIVALSKEIASELKVNSPAIERTALLCKADLATSLVFEFTELQGFIGADYAKISGEDKKVCQGIKEHYYPLNAESELAQNIEGQVVGIADKLDTICAVFVGGKIPTGSSDPLGVRRAALGIIKTIIDKKLDLNLSELIKQTLDLLPQKADILNKIEEFFIQRLIVLLSDKYRKDTLEACTKNKKSLVDLNDFIKRVELIENKINTKEFASIFESANRVSRILGANIIDKEPEISLFAYEAEKDLYNKIEGFDQQKITAKEYDYLFQKLIEINPSIEKFFEDVLVMDKDEKIKQNRFALLSKIKKLYDMISDFSYLQT